MSGPKRSFGDCRRVTRAAFVSAARPGLKSESCRSERPVCANAPSDCAPSAIAKTIVSTEPTPTVITPVSPKTAAVVRMSAGASPSGVSTGIAIPRATCSGEISRSQMYTPTTANTNASPGTNTKTNAVSITQEIARAIPSCPAMPTTATSAAASSAPTGSNPASVAIAKTGRAVKRAKNTVRIQCP